MTDNETIKTLCESPAVITHIEMLQGIINRMANNCANCKTWAVTLVAAILALSHLDSWQMFYASLGPIVIFYLLDCFYLGLERRFIKMQKKFISDVREGKPVYPYTIESSTWKEQLGGMVGGMVSISTTPMYLLLALVPLIFILLIH